jgi:hypothetical protein
MKGCNRIMESTLKAKEGGRERRWLRNTPQAGPVQPRLSNFSGALFDFSLFLYGMEMLAKIFITSMLFYEGYRWLGKIKDFFLYVVS